MVDFPGRHAREVAFELVRRLNDGTGKPAFAVSGALAFAEHGLPLPRPLGDVDIAAIEPVKSPTRLREALVDAGCEDLPSSRAFPAAVRQGRVPFVKNGIDCEILSQHHRAAKANPLQAPAARNLLARSRENLLVVDGVPVLDVDIVVVWKAILNRHKDRIDIGELVMKTRSDGTPAIRNRENVLNLVVDNQGKQSPAVEFLHRVMWAPWHGY